VEALVAVVRVQDRVEDEVHADPQSDGLHVLVDLVALELAELRAVLRGQEVVVGDGAVRADRGEDHLPPSREARDVVGLDEAHRDAPVELLEQRADLHRDTVWRAAERPLVGTAGVVLVHLVGAEEGDELLGRHLAVIAQADHDLGLRPERLDALHQGPQETRRIRPGGVHRDEQHAVARSDGVLQRWADRGGEGRLQRGREVLDRGTGRDPCHL